MRISPISNNNTSFNAQFVKNQEFLELSQIAGYRKGITQETLELGKKFKEIGKGQELEILKHYIYRDCNLKYCYAVVIKNHFTGKTKDFQYSKYLPFWDGLLIKLTQNKNKDFFSLPGIADEFIHLVTEEDK